MQHFTPWNEIRPFMERGARVRSVQTTREGAENGPLVDSKLKLWMPDGLEVEFRPTAFAVEQAKECMRKDRAHSQT